MAESLAGVGATIRVDNLHHGSTLAGISFAVAPGEILALVSSEGEARTELLQVLAGQRRPAAGSASVAGIDCRSPQVRQAVGVVGEAWGLYSRLTVQQNLLLFARLWQRPEGRIAEVLKATDLQAQAAVPAERLRPGEAARLRLARALLHDPPALLLNEPIGDVDRESASLIGFIISEAAERGRAVLLATFGHPRALDIATHLAYLEDGRLLQPALAPAAARQPADDAGGGAPIRHIAARRGERVLLFAPDAIRYAYAEEKAVYIETADGPYLVSLSLADLEDRLAAQGFYRCHRGFLVNLDWVKEITAWTRDSYSLILKDKREVPLSKHRAAELKRRLGW